MPTHNPIHTVHLGNDHAGLSLKESLKNELLRQGYAIEDHGTHTLESCDYPVFAKAVCDAVSKNENEFGILICGTGIGMSIMANRHKGIRAALCASEFQAKATREHNNANVLCLGERVTGQGVALAIMQAFLDTPFAGGRHQRRIDFFDNN